MNFSKHWLLILFLVALGCAGQEPTAPIFDENADAHRDISAAVADAEVSKRNIVLVFGANWCGDCRALHAQMHKPELATIIERNFVVVQINMGRWDKNKDLAEKYHVPLQRGIPALAVLDSQGDLLYAMEKGEFANARRMSFDSIKDFFAKWGPKR